MAKCHASDNKKFLYSNVQFVREFSANIAIAFFETIGYFYAWEIKFCIMSYFN